MTDKTANRKTPIHALHSEYGAKMTPFGGWDMPLHYGSQVEEHHAVRKAVGVFDVSHMGQVRIRGPRAYELVQRMVMNDAARLENVGQAMYTPMCNEEGGILDDLIVSKLGDEHYFLVVNASTQESDFEHMKSVADKFDLSGEADLLYESEAWAMLAVQGPEAESTVSRLFDGLDLSDLGYFNVREVEYEGAPAIISRTGYTGEDGFEVLSPPDAGRAQWKWLMEEGVQACGLGARDTLRLEAGYMLNGTDMTMESNPIECSMGWACKEGKDITPVGGDAVAKIRVMDKQRRVVGVELLERGIPRHDNRLSPKVLTYK